MYRAASLCRVHINMFELISCYNCIIIRTGALAVFWLWSGCDHCLLEVRVCPSQIVYAGEVVCGVEAILDHGAPSPSHELFGC